MAFPFKIIAYSAGLLTLTSTLVLSCGFEFPWQLLDNRKNTLLSLTGQTSDFDSSTSGDFVDRLALILPITATEKNNFLQSKNNYDEKHKHDIATATFGQNVAKQSCEATGSFYQHAASLFHGGQYEDAYKEFDVLSNSGSPKEKVCARYNLARVMERMPGDHGADAIKTYISTIELVADQGIDPYDLGLASYGQAAKLILENGDPNAKMGMISLGQVNNKRLKFEVGKIQKGSVAQLHRGLYFYVKQTLLGGETGKASVAIILRGLTDPDNPNARQLLDQSWKDPFIRKVILAYALNHDLFYQSDNPKVTQNLFDSLVKAVEEKTDMGDDWGALAAFAYQSGNIPKAQYFAEHGMKTHPQAMSAWILAKIALMNNQRDVAQSYYHQAIALLNDKTMVAEEQHKIQGEQSVLTLSRGDFVQALEQLWPVRHVYWGDIVYLAEDVLTVNELKEFADKHTLPLADHQAVLDIDSWDSNPEHISLLFRDLVAHRLFRDGREKEALSYYLHPADRQAVVDYLEAHQHIDQGKTNIEQAKGAWHDAKLMRWKGMEMVGTYGYPDYAPGYFFGGISQQPDNLDNSDNRQWSNPNERVRIHKALTSPDKRYHYRYLAAFFAIKAAEFIPSRTQAYAAMLCQANGWMQNTESYANEYEDQRNQPRQFPNLAQQTANDIYVMYVKNGAMVPFATHFGYNCPEPNFEAISLTQFKLMIQNVYNYLYQLKHSVQSPSVNP